MAKLKLAWLVQHPLCRRQRKIETFSTGKNVSFVLLPCVRACTLARLPNVHTSIITHGRTRGRGLLRAQYDALFDTHQPSRTTYKLDRENVTFQKYHRLSHLQTFTNKIWNRFYSFLNWWFNFFFFFFFQNSLMSEKIASVSFSA